MITQEYKYEGEEFVITKPEACAVNVSRGEYTATISISRLVKPGGYQGNGPRSPDRPIRTQEIPNRRQPGQGWALRYSR